MVVQTQEALQFAIGEKKGGEGEGVGEKVMEGARERVREGKKLQDELFEKVRPFPPPTLPLFSPASFTLFRRQYISMLC